MPYGLNDIKQAAIGAFSSVLFFLAIRQGDPIMLDPMVGILVGALDGLVVGEDIGVQSTGLTSLCSQRP